MYIICFLGEVIVGSKDFRKSFCSSAAVLQATAKIFFFQKFNQLLKFTSNKFDLFEG